MAACEVGAGVVGAALITTVGAGVGGALVNTNFSTRQFLPCKGGALSPTATMP